MSTMWERGFSQVLAPGASPKHLCELRDGLRLGEHHGRRVQHAVLQLHLQPSSCNSTSTDSMATVPQVFGDIIRQDIMNLLCCPLFAPLSAAVDPEHTTRYVHESLSLASSTKTRAYTLVNTSILHVQIRRRRDPHTEQALVVCLAWVALRRVCLCMYHGQRATVRPPKARSWPHVNICPRQCARYQQCLVR